MRESQRTQVRESAQYLRQVRPVDPAEIHEYVEGQPHPAAVRQVLREQAPELGLLERDDGRFGPVPEGPLEVEFDGVEALSPGLNRAVEDLLVERFGRGWPDGESGATLRATVREFKQQYLAGGTVTYDEETALGYAVYHLPVYFAAVQQVLADLAAADLLGRHLRVLDVGAGVGGPALGLADLVGPDTLVDYHAVEPSPAADLLERLLTETGPNVHTSVYRERIEEFDPSPSGAFDLVLFANVLSELDDPAQQVRQAIDWLNPEGSVVALAPADRNTAIGLRQVERRVEETTGATVYGPTARLWPHERPASTSWSFVRRGRLETPAVQRRLDEGDREPGEQTRAAGDGPERMPGDGEFVNVDLQYAYSVLRVDDRQAVPFRPDQRQVSKLFASERHVTERVDCAVVKLSPDLSTGGNPLFLVGDGSQQVDHFAVLTEQSVLNRALEVAGYGELLLVESALVLWNDDERAYNLVVDSETIVERVPA